MTDLPPATGLPITITAAGAEAAAPDPELLTKLADAFNAAAFDIQRDGTPGARDLNYTVSSTAHRMAVSFRKLAREAANPKPKRQNTDG